MFHLLGASTNSWWGFGDESYTAGLWRVCKLHGQETCVDYMELVEEGLLNGTLSMYSDIGGLTFGHRRHLNMVRTFVLLFIVLILSLLVTTTLVVCSKCRTSKVVFPRWLKLSMLIGQICSVGVGLACIILPTKSEEIFLHTDMKLRSSWMCIIFSNSFNIFAAILLSAIFCNDLTESKKLRQPVTFSGEEIEVAVQPVAVETKDKQTMRGDELEWDDTKWRIGEYANIKHSEKKFGTGNQIPNTEDECDETRASNIVTLQSDESSEFFETTKTFSTRRTIPIPAVDLARFSEIDLGRLQSPSFRNKSVRVKSSSFANRVPCHFSGTRKARINM